MTDHQRYDIFTGSHNKREIRIAVLLLIPIGHEMLLIPYASKIAKFNWICAGRRHSSQHNTSWWPTFVLKFSRREVAQCEWTCGRKLDRPRSRDGHAVLRSWHNVTTLFLHTSCHTTRAHRPPHALYSYFVEKDLLLALSGYRDDISRFETNQIRWPTRAAYFEWRSRCQGLLLDCIIAINRSK